MGAATDQADFLVVAFFGAGRLAADAVEVAFLVALLFAADFFAAGLLAAGRLVLAAFLPAAFLPAAFLPAVGLATRLLAADFFAAFATSALVRPEEAALACFEPAPLGTETDGEVG